MRNIIEDAMVPMDLSTLIQSAEQELARLDKRRTELITQIDELKRARNAFCLKPPSSVAIDSPPKEPSDSYVTTTSPTESKMHSSVLYSEAEKMSSPAGLRVKRPARAGISLSARMNGRAVFVKSHQSNATNALHGYSFPFRIKLFATISWGMILRINPVEITQ